MSKKVQNIVVQVDAESTKMMLDKISELNTLIANTQSQCSMLAQSLVQQGQLIEFLDNRVCELEGNQK